MARARGNQRSYKTFLASAGVIIAAAAAAAGALSVTEGADQAKARPHKDPMFRFWPVPMPRYPGAQEWPLTKGMDAADSRLFMSYFTTDDEPLAVATFYETRWRSAGYHVTKDITLQGGHVSALDVTSSVVRQVVIFKQGKRTIAFPSVSRGVPTGAAAQTKAEIPVYPGAEGVTRFGADDGSGANEVVMFVDFGKIRDNVAFYRTEMQARGWTLVQDISKVPTLPNKDHSLLFRRDNAECTINILTVPGSKQVRVHITVARGR